MLTKNIHHCNENDNYVINLIITKIKKLKKINHEKIYNYIYILKKEDFINQGNTIDISSRLANIYAVKNTNNFYIKYK